MNLRAPFAILSVLASSVIIVACQARGGGDPHAHGQEVGSLERELRDGPYLSGTEETFRLPIGAGTKVTQWSATAGALRSSGDRAHWVLPEPGVATLSAKVLTSA